MGFRASLETWDPPQEWHQGKAEVTAVTDGRTDGRNELLLSQLSQRQGKVKNEQEIVCSPENIGMAFLHPMCSRHPFCGLILQLSRGLALWFLCSIFGLPWKAGEEHLELKYLSSCLSFLV